MEAERYPSSGLPLSLRRPISAAHSVQRVAAIFRFTPTPKVSTPPGANGRVLWFRGSSLSRPDPFLPFQPEKSLGSVPPLESPDHKPKDHSFRTSLTIAYASSH